MTASTPYSGIRYLYNVLDTRSPSYNDALSVVGFTNTGGGTKSPLCSSNPTLNGIISNFFSPLPTNGNPNNTNLAGSSCRQWVS
ncbi:MAG: hypothetical protein R2726_22530 [Acidimicrobiales bacterium]